MNEFYEEILIQNSSGNLISFLFSNDYCNDEACDEMLEIIAKLHNNNEIDLFSVKSLQDISNLKKFEFWNGHSYFSKVIPLLEGTVEQIMALTNILVISVGDDGFAQTPNLELLKWCEVDVSRSKQIIQQSKSGDELALKHLVFALIANSQFEDSINFIRGDNLSAQTAGVVALGRMKLSVEQEETALQQISNSISGSTDAPYVSNLLNSARGIWNTSSTHSKFLQVDIIEGALKNDFAETSLTIASMLYSNLEIIEASLLPQMMSSLLNLKPEHVGTINMIDSAFPKLCNAGYSIQIINFLEELISKNMKKIKLDQFENFRKYLLDNNPKELSRVVSSWLLNGNMYTCVELVSMLNGTLESKNIINIRKEDIPKEIDEQIFLIHKVVGHFFMDTVAAASILLSFVKFGKKEAKEMAESFLFYPIFLNYGGDLHKYFESLTKDRSIRIKECAVRLIEKKTKYLENIKSMKVVNELHPTEKMKQIEHQMFSDIMQEAYKKASRGSIFTDLVTHQYLLYGVSSVNVFKLPDGSEKIMKTEMQQFSQSMEFPRMETIDPVGIDMMLRRYRAMGWA